METEFKFAGFEFPKPIYMLPKSKTTMAWNPKLGYKNELLKRKESRKVVGPYYVIPTPNTKGKTFYLESDFMPSLRWQYADEVSGTHIRHKGWYTDVFDMQDQTIRGIVFRLPSNRGFLAGWTMGTEMITELEYDIYSDEIDAANAADECARIAAERQIEFEAKENQEQS